MEASRIWMRGKVTLQAICTTVRMLDIGFYRGFG